MEDSAALSAGAVLLREQIAATDPARYDDPSNCEDWTVGQLISHVIGGGLRYVLLMQNATEADLVASRTHDFLADGDPLGTLDRFEEQFAAIYAEPDALDRIAHHRAGDVTGRQLRGMRVLEQVLHAWDIATSLGEQLPLDDELCQYILDNFDDIAAWKRLGFFGDPRPPRDESPSERLLALTGR